MRQFISKYTVEIYNTIGAGLVGFIGTKVFETWIQPVIITAICAVISLLISHYGRRRLERRKIDVTPGVGFPRPHPSEARETDKKLKDLKKNNKV